MTKLNLEDIAERLDITQPFLMIDEWEETQAGTAARGVKRLEGDDWFFASHLPSEQVMPATLQIEGMLQTLVLLIYAAHPHGEHRSFITNIDVQLVSAAKPGHTVQYNAKLLSFRRGLAKGEVEGSTDGQTLCRGTFSYASPHLMTLPQR